MIDVNKITSTLAKLPDAQLQQYAQMHKNDPYIMALAMSESSRRKDMRSVGQGAQGMQPQPKVVDQAVASMAPQRLPEAQGIGQLPAGNMDFADGGIVAFAGGGDTEDYWSYRDTDEGIRKAFRPTVREGEEYTPSIMGSLFGYNVLPREGAPYDAKTATRRSQYPGITGAEEAAAAAGAADGKAPPAPYQLPGSAAPRLMGQQDLAKLRQGIYDKQTFVDPAKAQVEALGKEMLSGSERRKQEFEDYTKSQGDVFKGKEERLKTREADIAKQSETNTGLAFLNAGLAIMSTPGGLATAIGKGARVGTEQYAAGLDKIRSAQERLSDARDKLEDLRLNRDDMTFKQRSALSADIDKAKIDAQKLGIDGIRLAADVNEKRASDIFGKAVDLEKTRYEQASANARANAPSGQERIAMLLGGGDIAKGLTRFAEIQAGKFNPTTAYTEYLSKRKEGDTVLTPQEFVTQIKSIQALMAGTPSVSNKPVGKAFD